MRLHLQPRGPAAGRVTATGRRHRPRQAAWPHWQPAPQVRSKRLSACLQMCSLRSHWRARAAWRRLALSRSIAWPCSMMCTALAGSGGAGRRSSGESSRQTSVQSRGGCASGDFGSRGTQEWTHQLGGGGGSSSIGSQPRQTSSAGCVSLANVFCIRRCLTAYGLFQQKTVIRILANTKVEHPWSSHKIFTLSGCSPGHIHAGRNGQRQMLHG